MIRRLIILLLIVGCGLFDKTYKCKTECEIIDPSNEYSGINCSSEPLQVEALDIDEAEEYCEDWYEVDSLNNITYSNIDLIVIYSCNCEVFP